MIALLRFAISPIGRWVVIGVAAVVAFGWWYHSIRKNAVDGYKVKIEKQNNETKSQALDARQDALRRFDAAPDGSVPDDGFARD